MGKSTKWTNKQFVTAIARAQGLTHLQTLRALRNMSGDNMTILNSWAKDVNARRKKKTPGRLSVHQKNQHLITETRRERPEILAAIHRAIPEGMRPKELNYGVREDDAITQGELILRGKKEKTSIKPLLLRQYGDR